MAKEFQPTEEGSPDALRGPAILEAAMIMFPDLAFDHITDALGAPEYSQQRLDALTTILGWLSAEFAWIEDEATRDQPWQVKYASETNREGVVRKTFDDVVEARDYASRKERTASFGWYFVERARKPFAEPNES